MRPLSAQIIVTLLALVEDTTKDLAGTNAFQWDSVMVERRCPVHRGQRDKVAAANSPVTNDH